MNEYQHKKKFGQHFLHDQTVLNEIITAIHPQATDDVVEIGAGDGQLTKLLIAQVHHLTAIEIDRDLQHILQTHFAHYNNFTLINKDVLKIDFSKLDANHALRLVGNLPYNIATPILFHCFAALKNIIDMHFMLQYEVAARICADTGSSDYGRLSIMSQYLCDTELLFEVPPSAFTPPPKVNSAVIRLIPHKDWQARMPQFHKLESLVKLAFQQRRKTIANNLKAFLTRDELIAMNIDPALRPQQLSLQDYLNILNHV